MYIIGPIICRIHVHHLPVYVQFYVAMNRSQLVSTRVLEATFEQNKRLVGSVSRKISVEPHGEHCA